MHMFSKQIGKNVEIYVNNVLVKSRESKAHLDDLQETINMLRKYQMKLNPTKYVFGVSSGKIPSFMISQRGIEANPESCLPFFKTFKQVF